MAYGEKTRGKGPQCRRFEIAKPRALISAPFPLALRNFLATGFIEALADKGFDSFFLSPYEVEALPRFGGDPIPNIEIPSTQGDSGVPHLTEITALDRLLKSIHLTGFAQEYPDGSLQNLTLSRRRNVQWFIAKLLTSMAPRESTTRETLRSMYARYRPKRKSIARAFDSTDPAVVIVASPGHYWLDHFVLDEAARRKVASACVMLSWDNLYSRGPMARRPDLLLVWSEEMRRQAIEVHGYPENRIEVVGPLQFTCYEQAPTPREGCAMRSRVGLSEDEPYLAYICGARTSEYDVEDILALRRSLRNTEFSSLKIVVRPHPQGDRARYRSLTARGILLDDPPDLTQECTHPEALDFFEIRHMAALLSEAQFVVSSWGTTALLEACIFDTPTIQLRWMDTVPHANKSEVSMVRDFQRYIHMRAFDETGARLYCDSPSDLASLLRKFSDEREAFSERRRSAVERLAKLPLGDAPERVAESVAKLVRES